MHICARMCAYQHVGLAKVFVPAHTRCRGGDRTVQQMGGHNGAHMHRTSQFHLRNMPSAIALPNMGVRLHVLVYACSRTCLHACMHVHAYMRACVLHACVHVAYTCGCMHACACICMDAQRHVCVFICPTCVSLRPEHASAGCWYRHSNLSPIQ